VLLVRPNDPVRVLKELMYELTGIPVRKQRLQFNGQQPDDEKTFPENNIFQEMTLLFSSQRFYGAANPSTTQVGTNDRMGTLELDHFGYLFCKVAKQFRQGEEPHREVEQQRQ
jgi:hypothetical protein